MQIQNNYNGYSGTEYQRSHTHHITECLYDHEEKLQNESGAGGGRAGQASRETSAREGVTEQMFFQTDGGRKKQETGLKKGMGGLLRQLWDSMGEEAGDTEKAGAAAGANRPAGAAEGALASSAARTLIPAYLTEKWESVKDKVRAKAGAAFQGFDKKKDAFLALADPGRRFRGRKGEAQKRQEKAGRGTRRRKPEILTAVMSDTHLMDSYSKKGEYCRLNDNLSYRRERLEANRRAFAKDGPDEDFAGNPRRREEGLDKRL